MSGRVTALTGLCQAKVAGPVKRRWPLHYSHRALHPVFPIARIPLRSRPGDFLAVAPWSHNAGMGLFKRLGEKLAAPPEQLRAQEIRKWCDEIHDVQQIGVLRPRCKARVAGIVQSIKVVPRDQTCTFEVQVYDGTDEVVGVWLGRRRIPGIELGRGLILMGTLGRYGRGPMTIINPAYELLPAEAD